MQIIVNGILTNFESVNPHAKIPVILLHGWGGLSKSWTPVVKLLNPHFCYYLVDLPGFGFTQPLDDTPSIPEYTDFIRAFAKSLKLKKFILAGHSFGGQITIDYAIEYPQDLICIILTAPAAVRERSNIVKAKITAAKIVRPLVSLLPNDIYNKFLDWYTPESYRNADEYQRKVLKKIITYNLKPKLHLIKVPTHIVWGSNDIVIPFMGKYMAENIKNSDLQMISGAGHQLHLTHTLILANILNKTLSVYE